MLRPGTNSPDIQIDRYSRIHAFLQKLAARDARSSHGPATTASGRAQRLVRAGLVNRENRVGRPTGTKEKARRLDRVSQSDQRINVGPLGCE